MCVPLNKRDERSRNVTLPDLFANGMSILPILIPALRLSLAGSGESMNNLDFFQFGKDHRVS
jgi:hypothetical protein